LQWPVRSSIVSIQKWVLSSLSYLASRHEDAYDPPTGHPDPANDALDCPWCGRAAAVLPEFRLFAFKSNHDLIKHEKAELLYHFYPTTLRDFTEKIELDCYKDMREGVGAQFLNKLMDALMEMDGE
jgi:hypothetical protein